MKDQGPETKDQGLGPSTDRNALAAPSTDWSSANRQSPIAIWQFRPPLSTRANPLKPTRGKTPSRALKRPA